MNNFGQTRTTYAFMALASFAVLVASPMPSQAAVWGPYYVSNDDFGHCYDRRLTPEARIAECRTAFRIPRLNRLGADILFERLAQAYEDEYDFKSAIAVYDRALKTSRDEDTRFFLYLRGSALLAEGNHDLASAAFAEAAKAGQEDYADAGLAEEAANEDRFDDAVALYKKALALNDREYTLMANLALIYIRKGDYSSAMALDSELEADLHFGSFPAAERCWHRAVINRDLDLALQDCNHALGILPDDSDVLDSKGLVEFRLGHYDDAIADYKAAISHNPRLASSLFMLGVLEIRKGDAKEGKTDVTAALAIYPQIGQEYASYGIVP